MALSFAMLAIVIINILLAVAVLAGVIVFEVWLSRRKSRWPGLIMPILSFALSLLLVFGFVAFSQALRPVNCRCRMRKPAKSSIRNSGWRRCPTGRWATRCRSACCC